MSDPMSQRELGEIRALSADIEDCRDRGVHDSETNKEAAAKLPALLAEIDRLNEWADGFSDAQMKERQTGEQYQRELRAKAESVKATVLNAVDEILKREIGGAEETLKLDLNLASRHSADGWRNAAAGIQIAVNKLRTVGEG